VIRTANGKVRTTRDKEVRIMVGKRTIREMTTTVVVIIQVVIKGQDNTGEVEVELTEDQAVNMGKVVLMLQAVTELVLEVMELAPALTLLTAAILATITSCHQLLIMEPVSSKKKCIAWAPSRRSDSLVQTTKNAFIISYKCERNLNVVSQLHSLEI